MVQKKTRLMRVDDAFYWWSKKKSKELGVSIVLLTENIPKAYKHLLE